jgi:hypothetical protein
MDGFSISFSPFDSLLMFFVPESIKVFPSWRKMKREGSFEVEPVKAMIVPSKQCSDESGKKVEVNYRLVRPFGQVRFDCLKKLINHLFYCLRVGRYNF